MGSRGRNYMDRLLGRNEGSESRDFTEGRRYGEDPSFYDDSFNDSESEWNQNQYRGERRSRLQASRTRPRPDFYKSASERDYSTRRNPPEERSSWGSQYDSPDDAKFSNGIFRNPELLRGGFFGKGPKGYTRSDDRIKEEVSEALYRDYSVDASEIEVDVKDGIVTLSGIVDNRQTKRAAEECIEGLTGVIDVHNRLRITERGNVSNLRNGPDQNEKQALS